MAREEVAVSTRDSWHEKLARLSELKDGWNGYQAPAPSSNAIVNAGIVLEAAAEKGMPSTRLAASAVGGVGITFKSGSRMVYVELYNDGGAQALFTDASSDCTKAFGPDHQGARLLLDEAKAYLNG